MKLNQMILFLRFIFNTETDFKQLKRKKISADDIFERFERSAYSCTSALVSDSTLKEEVFLLKSIINPYKKIKNEPMDSIILDSSSIMQEGSLNNALKRNYDEYMNKKSILSLNLNEKIKNNETLKECFKMWEIYHLKRRYHFIEHENTAAKKKRIRDNQKYSKPVINYFWNLYTNSFKSMYDSFFKIINKSIKGKLDSRMLEKNVENFSKSMFKFINFLNCDFLASYEETIIKLEGKKSLIFKDNLNIILKKFFELLLILNEKIEELSKNIENILRIFQGNSYVSADIPFYERIIKENIIPKLVDDDYCKELKPIFEKINYTTSKVRLAVYFYTLCLLYAKKEVKKLSCKFVLKDNLVCMTECENNQLLYRFHSYIFLIMYYNFYYDSDKIIPNAEILKFFSLFLKNYGFFYGNIDNKIKEQFIKFDEHIQKLINHLLNKKIFEDRKYEIFSFEVIIFLQEIIDDFLNQENI